MTRQAVRAVLIAAAVMLAYQVVTASAARGLGLTWRQAAWFELGILAIYPGAGLIAAGRTGNLWIGIAAGFAAGGADALMGWRITAAIYQPMRIIYDHPNAEFEFMIEILIWSAILATIGAMAGLVIRSVADRVGVRRGPHPSAEVR